MNQHINAKVVSDSIWNHNRILTLELTMPSFIVPQFLTHRAFSRNGQSMRAMSFSRVAAGVRSDPYIPDNLGADKRGMIPGASVEQGVEESFAKDLRELAEYTTQKLARWDGVIHHQWLNRYLEPWTCRKYVVTATDWGNFFKLRRSEDAQHEIHVLAEEMYAAYSGSVPVEREYHVPYVSEKEMSNVTLDWDFKHFIFRVSAARCAKVSYGNPGDTQAGDITLADKLMRNGHWSPFEHVALSCYGRSANFTGWRQMRSQYEH